MTDPVTDPEIAAEMLAELQADRDRVAARLADIAEHRRLAIKPAEHRTVRRAGAPATASTRPDRRPKTGTGPRSLTG